MNMILKTTDLCKNFKEQKAVRDVSLNIERNSIYGLLGANGAGKSTILKMITGIYRPTSGKIEFNSHTWSRSDLNNIRALIEMPPLYENLSAYENLKARTLALGLSEKRIKEVLEIVRLENTGRKKTGHFSLGMKQRLGIALALLPQPQLLILDAPVTKSFCISTTISAFISRLLPVVLCQMGCPRTAPLFTLCQINPAE